MLRIRFRIIKQKIPRISLLFLHLLVNGYNLHNIVIGLTKLYIFVHRLTDFLKLINHWIHRFKVDCCYFNKKLKYVIQFFSLECFIFDRQWCGKVGLRPSTNLAWYFILFYFIFGYAKYVWNVITSIKCRDLLISYDISSFESPQYIYIHIRKALAYSEWVQSRLQHILLMWRIEHEMDVPCFVLCTQHTDMLSFHKLFWGHISIIKIKSRASYKLG